MKSIILKPFKYLAVLLFVLFIADGIFVVSFPAEKLPENQVSAAIVLGAAPGSRTLQKRTEQGIAVYQSGKVKDLILSGGKSRETDRSEAEYMKKIVKSQNSDINPILEGKSNNTWENLKFASELISKEDGIVIVTDQYHLARSVLTAKMQGYKQVYWSSPDSTYYSESAMQKYRWREIAGIPWYILLWISGNR